MQEFFKDYYWLLTFSVEAIAAVTALLCYKKYKHTIAKFFIYFLTYVFVCEVIALYTFQVEDGVFRFLKGTVFQRNFWWMTLFWCIGSPSFYAFFYLKLIESVKIRKVIKLLFALFLAFSIGTIAYNFDDFFTRYFTSILIFGGLFILFLVSSYFYEMLLSDKIINFYRSIYFYISATIFIWVLITTPLMFYDIYYTTADWSFIILKWEIYFFANMFMYLTFTFALLWCKPEKH